MKILEDPENVTQAMCDEIKGDHKHLMIAIGYVGIMSCYLDLSLEDAKQRYLKDKDETGLNGVGITIFGFDDEFHSYEVSEKD